MWMCYIVFFVCVSGGQVKVLRKRSVRMTWRLIMVVMLVALVGWADQEVEVRVELAPQVIPYHRTAMYRVIVEAPEKTAVTIPVWESALPELEVSTLPVERVSLSGGRQRLIQVYMLDPVKVGKYEIPPQRVQWGENQYLETKAVSLEVRELLPEEVAKVAQFAPLVGPNVVSPKGIFVWFWWVGGILAGLFVLFAIVRWWRRGRGGETDALVVELPWEAARRRLSVLTKKGLAEGGQYERYYVELSSILRAYIEARFLFQIQVETTPEFLAEVVDSALLNETQKRFLSEFLRHCDRVKFAQHEPSLSDMQRAMRAVSWFVEETVSTSNSESEVESVEEEKQ